MTAPYSPVHFGLIFEVDAQTQRVGPAPVWAGDSVGDFTEALPATGPVFAVQSGRQGPSDVVLFGADTFTVPFRVSAAVSGLLAAAHPRKDLIGPQRIQRTVAALRSLRAKGGLVALAVRDHGLVSPLLLLDVQIQYSSTQLEATIQATFRRVKVARLGLVQPVADEETAALSQVIVFGVLP